MFQKSVAETFSLMSALDQSGNIRNEKTLIFFYAYDTKVGLKRRKRVIGNLRSRRAYP